MMMEIVEQKMVSGCKNHSRYVKFHIDYLNDFRDHSMSVSDIAAGKAASEISFHYVDSVGVQKLENVMKSENCLKNAEMAMEEDYGMIDGIINNGRAFGLEECRFWNQLIFMACSSSRIP